MQYPILSHNNIFTSFYTLLIKSGVTADCENIHLCSKALLIQVTAALSDYEPEARSSTHANTELIPKYRLKPQQKTGSNLWSSTDMKLS